jgi:ParB-like chromosome segregation protein Spo0J
MATTTRETARHVALVDIRVRDNVRALDSEHVKALAGSIKIQGTLVPVVVRDHGDSFELVADFHRVAAARSRTSAAEVPPPKGGPADAGPPPDEWLMPAC